MASAALWLANPHSPLVHFLGRRLPAVLCAALPRAWESGLGVQLPQQQEVKSQSQEMQVTRRLSNRLLAAHYVPTDGKAGIRKESLW